MTTIPLFNGFYDVLYHFLQSVSVSDEYLSRQHPYWRQLVSMWRQIWSKIRKIVNFCCVNDHNTTFQSGFILKLLVFWSFEWIFIGIAFEFNLYNIYPIMKNKIFRLKWKNNVQNYKFYDLQDKVHIKHKSKFWIYNICYQYHFFL